MTENLKHAIHDGAEEAIHWIFHLPWLWFGLAILVTLLFKSPAWGLVIGVVLAFTVRNGAKYETARMSKRLLEIAVTLLGFGMSLKTALQVGASSALVTFVSIGLTLLIGMLICRVLRIDKELSLLLSGGTAICGGSAIAAFSSSMKSSHVNTAVAMAVIFLLNGLALVVFPPLGHLLGLDQTQFGFWAALAIHDTSSVVGAGAVYGSQALEVATVVKLTRALWIIPLSVILAKIAGGKGKTKIPTFLIGFLLAAALRSLLPQFEAVWGYCTVFGKRLMVASLFLIGSALSKRDLREVGHKPLLAAFILWVIVSVLTLFAVKMGMMPQLHL